MRTFLLIFTLSIFTLPISAQTIEGTYANKWKAPTGESIKYSLTLHEDGNFIFSTVRTYSEELPDKIVSAKGTWNLNGHLLELNTANDTESENALQDKLDMTKARYNSVSKRHPKFNLMKPSLKFYHSEVFYAKDMELVKTDDDVTSINKF